MTRILPLLILTIISLSGCQQDNEPTLLFDVLATDEVTSIPEYFKVNTPDTLLVSFAIPNKCYSFNGFDVQTKNDTLEIYVVSRIVDRAGLNCDALENYTEIKELIYTPQEVGEKTLNFFAGYNTNNTPIFLTYPVSITE